MRHFLSLYADVAIVLSWATTVLAGGNGGGHSDPVCEQIKQSMSSASGVFYPGDSEFDKATHHWAVSSDDAPKCAAEPANAADLGKIMKIVGRTRTKFAVQSGGHGTNPGFSSTPGVHIYLGRLSTIKYIAGAQTVEVGSGLIWDDVYDALAPHGVNVAGGRVTGIGIGGFILGGGYSWKANQYGLTVDTVTAFELVKPDGSVATITQSSDCDLFFALKGGGNNFGIVTKFTIKTHPQTQVWGGYMTYLPTTFNEVKAATATFAMTNTDPKASLLTTFVFVGGTPLPAVQLFYDGPTPPAGLFDDFLAIPSISGQYSTQPFKSLFLSSPSNSTAGTRGRFHTVSLQQNTPAIVDTVVNETMFWGSRLAQANDTFTLYTIEPFLQNAYVHSNTDTAFPSIRSPGLQPFNAYFGWTDPAKDAIYVNAIKQTVTNIAEAAIQQGQREVAKLPLYSNYAIHDTPVSKLYGSNLPKLRRIKNRVDPNNVMGLTGGFKL